jgi:biotin carboxyl carrier protein
VKYLTTVNGTTYEIEINQNGQITVNGEERTIDFLAMQPPLYSLLLDNASYEGLVEERDEQLNVMLMGDLFEVSVKDERAQRLAGASGGFGVDQGEISLRSPMPGLIVSVPVAEGQAVSAGDTLIVLESMKMENDIKAPRGGTIGHIHVAKGDRVEQNKVLLTLA